MQEAGILLHFAKSGRGIVKLTNKVEVETVLFDSRRKKILKVLELIGPVRSPYASAILLSDKAKPSVAGRVYYDERSDEHVVSKR